MEHAIKHEIRIKMEENPVKYTSLKERLEQLIELRNARQLTIEELLEEYYQLRKDMINTEEETESFGLKDTRQLPFYQLLAECAPEDIEQEGLKDLTEIITEVINENAGVDGVDNEDVKILRRKKMIKRISIISIPIKDIERVSMFIVQEG